ncbi:protein eiger-like [Acyrthosiphon pisum]|uniref:THD domain-containing protein n=1 Tax=Acyrthosiphon pisum TaxID=7029 RepID=A0A8R1WA32_ACYPI|nr:protein eiger-like [Acyrthosiphon pisum]|eukprot:XP_003247539.2 PREDICTED: protein eiger-like [Acyrthosiphon pisum]
MFTLHTRVQKKCDAIKETVGMEIITEQDLLCYVSEVPMLTTNIQLSPQNMDAVGDGFARNYNMVPSTKRSPIPSMPIKMIVFIFPVLLCIFSCVLTVTFSYKWHMDSNQLLVATVEDAIRDLNTFTDIVRDELLAKHVSNTYKDQHKSNIDGNDYEEVAGDFDEGDRFMGRDSMDNNWPANQYQANESNKPKNRDRRNAVIDATTIVKNELNSSKNGTADVEIIQEENTMRTYRQERSKKMGSTIKKRYNESDEKSYEDFKDTLENAAAHFTSDSSKYSTKIHQHYNGNGRLKHPDGDFRDWTQHWWDKNLNTSNHFIMKNGQVEIIKPGLYFVYAQIYYSDTHDINGYYVMKNDEKILGCTSTRHQDTQASDSCYTAGLIYFNSKDNLSIRGLDTHRFIILDPVKSFFGLFRIS